MVSLYIDKTFVVEQKGQVEKSLESIDYVTEGGPTSHQEAEIWQATVNTIRVVSPVKKFSTPNSRTIITFEGQRFPSVSFESKGKKHNHF